MCKYVYSGPVMLFDTYIESCWKASTFAVSDKKAKSNLAYQYKKLTNKLPNTKITLPGKMVAIT